MDLPEVAKQGMNIRVVNLAGQIVMERNAVSGNSRQTLVIGDLPGGLYFLQIVLDGRVMSVEKFVKQ
ncbi:MAG: T9SS type A sorting domain-containing protein [Saprospiraceae bacterium]